MTSAITTTPSAGSVSSPVNGGATNAATVKRRMTSPKALRTSALLESTCEPRAREAFEQPDSPRDERDRLVRRGRTELAAQEALGEPDAPASDDHLEGDEHGHQLEHVRDAAGWKG